MNSAIRFLSLGSVAIVAFTAVVMLMPDGARLSISQRIALPKKILMPENVPSRQGGVAQKKSEGVHEQTPATLIDSAFSFVPASSENTGRDMFIISSTGTIYMNDQGSVNALQSAFAPVAPTWTPTE